MTDLASCHKIGRTYLCNHLGVLHRHFNDTCLGSLYDQKFNSARKLCNFHVEPATDRIFSLPKNQFLIYLTQPMTVPLTCHTDETGRTLSERHLERGSQIFQMPPRCVAQFRDHMVYSDMTIKHPGDSLHFNWKWQEKEIFSTSTADTKITIAIPAHPSTLGSYKNYFLHHESLDGKPQGHNRRSGNNHTGHHPLRIRML